MFNKVDDIKITIAIPTYNGSKYIQYAIDSVLKQIDDTNKEFINIHIFDNHSTDETQKIVRKNMEQYASIILYHRHDSNIGYDRNIDSIFKYSQNSFIKILADDDELINDALNTYLEYLRKYPDLRVLVNNFDVYDENLEKIVSSVDIEKDILCENGDDFLENSKGRYGQVSSLLIHRDCWNKIDKTIGMDTNYIHVFTIMAIVYENISFVSKKRMLKIRDGSPNFKTSSDNMVIVPLKGLKIVKYFYEIYKTKVLKKLIFEQRIYVLKNILSAQIIGFKSKKNVLKVLYISEGNSFFFWIIYFPLVLMPQFVFRVLKFLKERYK